MNRLTIWLSKIINLYFARSRPSLCDRPHPVRQADRRFPAHRRQARPDGGRDHGGAPARLSCGAREGCRTALRSRSRHGQAARRPRRLVGRRQCACRSMAAMASRSNSRSRRVLCDARILNIFEGAAEIQAQVIARRLLEGGN